MRKILVVIDMQKDFIDGALGTAEAEAIVDQVAQKIKSYPREDVYATLDTHGEDYLQTEEGRYLPVVHCVKDTDGWRLHETIAPLLLPNHIIEKPTFGSVALGELMYLENDREEIEVELVGLCTDICVVSNALLIKAFVPHAHISVDASCCAGVTPDKHNAALETMRSCQIEVKGV